MSVAVTEPPHTMRRMRIAIALALAALLIPAAARAAQDDDTPRGYRFCGWKDFADGGWTYEEPEPGAFLRLYARKMSCRTARRKHRRVRYERTAPYRAKLKGYRCVQLEQGYEYADIRCARKHRKKVALRWQTGS